VSTATTKPTTEGASAVQPGIIQPDKDGRVIVGVADIALATEPTSEIITHALGSCIGVTIYDPVARIAGLLHFMLPMSTGAPEKAASQPAMFGDLGIPLLFKSAYALGAAKERLIVCAAGGAEILADDGCFRVGSRNRTLLRKIFWQNNVLISSEDTGGSTARTMSIQLSSGRVDIRTQEGVKTLWPR
jgi:chemotaxis protein CheD